MNITNNDKNNSAQIQRIAGVLMYAFRINPTAHISDKLTNKNDTESWIINTLLNLDEQLAESVLPILIDRFEQYQKDIRNDKY